MLTASSLARCIVYLRGQQFIVLQEILQTPLGSEKQWAPWLQAVWRSIVFVDRIPSVHCSIPYQTESRPVMCTQTAFTNQKITTVMPAKIRPFN